MRGRKEEAPGAGAFRWLRSTRLLSWPRRAFSRFLRRSRAVLLVYNDPERAAVIDFINRVRNERTLLMANNEAYQLYMLARNTRKIPGDIAEVGVYKGGSSKIICEAKGDRALHLFDTFEGLPRVDKVDGDFKQGQLASSYEDVKKSFEGCAGVSIYKGIFPETAAPVADKKFSLVNLDVDTYESTTNCLRFFYPRMSRGGVLVSHNYINAPGVRKAFDEFFAEKPEPLVEFSGTQCAIVKL
jgi:hypothetical protein